MKRFLPVLVWLLLASMSMQAQITTPVKRANFGVDGDLRANFFNGFLENGNDDWFRNVNGTGDFIIDTTGASYILSRYLGESNVLFGVTVSGRPESLSRVESRVGLYINTLPLHARVDNEREIAGWLRELQDEQLKSREFQHTALSDIRQWINVQGELF